MSLEEIAGRAARFSRRISQRLRGPLDAATYRRSAGALRASTAGAPIGDTAVVVHLFHVQVWPEFLESLGRLSGVDHDLFVTLPFSERSFGRVVRSARPDAHVVIVPNRGRVSAYDLMCRYGYDLTCRSVPAS